MRLSFTGSLLPLLIFSSLLAFTFEHVHRFQRTSTKELLSLLLVLPLKINPQHYLILTPGNPRPVSNASAYHAGGSSTSSMHRPL
jgi:hypothetical protein